LVTKPDTLTVLVVAHEDQIRATATDALQNRGFGVVLTRCGRQAVEAVRRDRTIDLLVTEMDLPDLDGITLAQLAQRHRPDLKVLLLSADRAELRVAAKFDLYGLKEPVRAEVLATVASDIVRARS
jgi:DNA-binding NtrC family response regulator